MEHEMKEVFMRRRENDFDERGGGKTAEDVLRLHGFILEQLGNELNLIVDIIMAMDGRFDDIKDEMECRFQEEDYKFEVAFEELYRLRKRKRIVRG